MWNDEDNNPYGAFDRPDPHLSDSLHSAISPSPYDRESTPPSSRSSSRGPPDYVSRQPDTDDEEEDNSYGVRQGALSSRKRGGYDSRIEQILYENPDLQILIVDAGKNHEGGGSFIVYTIRTGDIEVRRRYSEFASLRQTLVNLHPTLVIPPIPEKHSVADYAAKPTKAKEDTAIIELRKRMLAVFLNRCRKMKEVREDGVWWRFLDPNVSWSEVLHSHPASSVPKNNLKAPPLDPANPTPAHAWLPVPSSSAKLKSTAAMPSPSDAAANTQTLGRFPPTSRTLSEQDLDPYFINFEASTRELELLLQGNIEKVNRRTLAHLSSLSADLMELGARYNGFSLSEQSPTVAAAIERIGQAADTSYIETEELSSSLGASFAEPMRESAQFASVVRSVLRYRVLKRVQEEMTREELSKKKALLDSLERSEQEAKRIEQYLNSTASPSVATKPRSMSASSATSIGHDREREPHRGSAEDTASIDSDFPPTHSDAVPSASQGTPQRPEGPASPPVHRKSASGNFVTNRIFGRISHAVHGFVDVDPERTRRDQIGKTKESLIQLEQALQVSEKDVKDASAGVLQDLKRFQKEKEEDLRRYMVAYARCHLDWARKNLETWTEAKEEVNKIVAHAPDRLAWRLYRALLLFSHFPSLCSSCFLRHPVHSSIVLSRAATRRVQLTFTTSSTKRRRVVEEPRRSGASPSLSVASRARHADAGERRHGLQQQHHHHRRRDHGSPSPEPPLPQPPPTLAPSVSNSNLDSRSSASPSPRYIPAHLQEEVLGAGSRSGASRPPTPEPSGNADSPSAACAGLSLNSDPVTDMSSSEKSSAAAAPQQSQREVRSSSPAVKRRVSEIAGNEQQSQDVEMETGSSEQQSNGADSRPAQRRATSVDMIGSEENAETAKNSAGDEATRSNGSDPVYPTPSSMSTYTASTSTRESSKTHEAAGTPETIPSIDEQVAMVMALMAKPLQDKQKGYVVSANWLNRVLARSSQAPRGGVIDKSAMEGEIGPVDNSDLVLVTDPSTSFKDEAGDPFVPLRPGLQMGEDFEIVSQEAWDLIMKWYGLAEQSPAIVRYAHNTNTAGGEENIQYEINPPIFTILKLSNPANGVTTQSLKDKSTPPVKTLASRHTNFQKWLRQAKELAHIDMKTKVRVWKILGGLSSTETSGVITPAASRSSSPAPGATLIPSAGNSLVLDVNMFVSLAEGSQRELLEDARDQTANEKYNGSMTLDLAGLTANDVVVLEEQIPGGEWVSEASKQALSRLSIPSGNNKNGLAKPKAKTPSVSGRSSPIPEATRGRRKDGRPKGITGFGNLGNTCYMNSALQCVRSVEELTYYFLNDVYKKDLNPNNPLAHNGDVARAYANLLHVIYDEGPVSFSPKHFKHTIGRYGPAFSGYGQQDSQEFLLFLLDGLQEDLNRIKKKPYIEKPDSTDEMVHNHEALKEFANKCWDIYKARNDSVITDLFAGMYKSTLVCPVCNKVSIIFDPFNNLTLQLPVESLWSKEIFYFPLHKPPVLLDVEIDKNSSIKALKEYVAKKMGTDPQRLIMAEIYKCKFYKLFDNTSTIADSNIGPGDDIGIFEVESVPTNYNPDRPKKSFSMLSFSHMDTEDIPSIDSPRADRLLVPIFNRVSRPGNRYGSRQMFGAPLFAVFTREEARDYDTILGKVLSAVATLTTRDILHEMDDADSAQDEGPDSDTVVMNEEDAESADSKIKTASVEGEDGLVDVFMRDASDASQESTAKSIPRRLRNLFQMKVVKSRSEVIPLGFSSLEENKDYPLISSRLQRKPAGKPGTRKPQASRLRERPNSPVSSSDDELNDEPEAVNKRVPRTSDESDGSDADSDSESGGDIYPGTSRMFSESKKARNGAVEPEPQDAPLIRPGEGIVLDWSEENHDALFGADPRDENSLRGSPTWTNVEHFPDPELTKKRQLRQNRRKKGLTLDQCLDEFGREEILSENDAWYCPRCKEHRRASKTFELWKVPDILVIHLKRFSAHRGFRDKIDDLVDFPVEGLDLSGRVRDPEPGESLIYDLFAVDNHYGGLGGGHYTAYAKNFLTGEWHEYNDAHVSKPIDPQKVVSTAAYLLFYRRRSDRPLGGKLLQDITESSVRGADSDSPADSRAESPAGEGRRLGDSSRNGSSSALAGVGAAHQAGDGGLRTVTQVRNVEVDDEEDDDDDDEMPPKYSNGLRSGEQSLGQTHRLQGMDTEDLDPSGGMQSNPLPYVNEPAWSFDRAADAHGPSQMTAAAPGSYYDEDDDEGLFDDEDDDDAASNQAVGGGDMSDSELPLADETGDYPPMVLDDVPPVSDDEDEELPVVELRVNEEDKIVSD